MVRISLMQDQSDVIAYSKKLKETLSNVSKTRKDLAAMIDPDSIKKQNQSLYKQLNALEK